jgi:plasmid stability protein
VSPPNRADEGVTIRAMAGRFCAYARDVLLNVNVPDEVRRRLEAAAAVRGVTVEELARELLAEHVPNIDVVPRRRRLALAGIGASKHGAASRVDELLADGFGL